MCIHILLPHHSVHLSFTVWLVLLFCGWNWGICTSAAESNISLCGIWNLDSFCPIFDPFRISPNIKNLHAFAREAFYPHTHRIHTTSDQLFCSGILLPVFYAFQKALGFWRFCHQYFCHLLTSFFYKNTFVSFNLLYAIRYIVVNRNGTMLNSSLVMY